MKTAFTVMSFSAVMLASLIQVSAKDNRLAEMLKAPDSLVWAGLDYSMMRMIGKTNTIPVPDLLLQDMPAKWNDLFLDERIEGVAAALQKQVSIDLTSVTERNRSLGPAQIVLQDQTTGAINATHITSNDISRLVREYKVKRDRGLGLIFIIDRFVYLYNPPELSGRIMIPGYTTHHAAVYVVFFDIASREVISSQREVRRTLTGGSFRNFWFGPIKDIDSDLRKYR